MKSKFQVFIPLLFSVAVIIGMVLGYTLRDNMPNRSFFSKSKNSSVEELVYLIENNYVDSVNTSKLADTAMAAILAKLDPHSILIPKDELQAINEEMQGGFFGVGIEYNIINDTLHVINVLKDGPSDKAGLIIGDKIIKVNDSGLVGKTGLATKARKLFRGNLDSKVRVTLLRAGQLKDVTITRGIIPLKTVQASYMIDASLGYIKIESFSTKTYKEFMAALTALKSQGLKKLVLDLRGNGGGVLDEAIEIADEFLDGDKLISYTEGLHYPKKEYRCRRDGQFESGELVVLADGGSASASEILLGALQDWDRATIMGSKTFGKGLVQTQYNLSDGSGLRLTTARYFTPLGRSIQRSYANGKAAYYEQGMGKHRDTGSIGGQQTFTSPKGKKLFDKNGITPDLVVQNADSAYLTPEVAYLLGHNYFGEYAYLFSMNEGLKTKFSNLQQFIADYKITPHVVGQFESFVVQKDTAVHIKPKARPEIDRWLKIALARQLFGVKGYIETFNNQDSTFNGAVNLLHKTK